MTRMLLLAGALAASIAAVSAAAAPAGEIDPATLAAIRDEGLQRSQVMELAGWLGDVYGPRLTGSPEIEAAGEWARRTLQAWGVANVREERFPFGAGWSLERFHAQMVEPGVMPIIGYPHAWTSSTDGTVTADVVRLDVRSEADLEAYRGDLRGAIVLPQPARAVQMLERDLVLRMDDALLAEAARPAAPRQAPRRSRPGAATVPAQVLQQFYLDEGVAAVLDRGRDTALVNGAPSGSGLPWPTQRTDGGTVFLGRGGPRDARAGNVAPAATIAVEHYNRMVRLLERGLPVRVEINIRTRFHAEDGRLNGFNILGEIPGTDLRDEVVMLGAHFDSTHASTGATDNAGGVAAMMEALRILLAVGAEPRRTIRIALWGAEEQGLIGSREYVRAHMADRRTMTPGAEFEKLSAYYNLDNGAGRIRGIWLQCNAAAGTIFEPWIESLADLGVTTLGPRAVGGTDHLAFDEVGLPGFQFMQDRLEYASRTHHSNMDFLDRIQREDLMQMAVVAAVFAYNTAMLDELLPRRAPSAVGQPCPNYR